jgi:mono/diheme cytochrome c family protein
VYSLRVLLVFLFVLAVVGLTVLLSGIYDVGADAPDWRWVEKLAAATRNASIAARAKDIHVPDVSRPERVAQGAEHYSEMCTACHGAPGADASEIRKGLYPQPPDLHQATAPSDPARQFWVIKHGVKMSAMPAWGATHDDEAIWSIVAFLQKLPSLSPADYRALTAQHAGTVHHHQHAEHESADTKHDGRH